MVSKVKVVGELKRPLSKAEGAPTSEVTEWVRPSVIDQTTVSPGWTGVTRPVIPVFHVRGMEADSTIRAERTAKTNRIKNFIFVMCVLKKIYFEVSKERRGVWVWGVSFDSLKNWLLVT